MEKNSYQHSSVCIYYGVMQNISFELSVGGVIESVSLSVYPSVRLFWFFVYFFKLNLLRSWTDFVWFWKLFWLAYVNQSEYRLDLIFLIFQAFLDGQTSNTMKKSKIETRFWRQARSKNCDLPSKNDSSRGERGFMKRKISWGKVKY
jgi:hypothetical protein